MLYFLKLRCFLSKYYVVNTVGEEDEKRKKVNPFSPNSM